MTDIIFAVDSVPAIFAVTKEPLIVFTSNIFAILGLRAMFFLLAGVMHRFHLLKYGLGVILVFVGLKMAWLNEAFGGKFPIGWSLGIIGGVLIIGGRGVVAVPKKSGGAAWSGRLERAGQPSSHFFFATSKICGTAQRLPLFSGVCCMVQPFRGM